MVAVPSCPVTPIPSRPTSPVSSLRIPPAASHSATPLPSRPATPTPSRPTTPVPSRPTTPTPSRPVTPTPSHPPSPTPSRPVSPVLPSPATASVPQITPPSGTATVPDLSSITNLPPKTYRKRKLAGDVENTNNSGTRPTRTSGAGNKRKATGGATPAAKKQRVASSGAAPSPSFAIDVPVEAPEWVSDSLGLLTHQDLGPQWKLLVVAWLEREEHAGFVEQERLSPTGRLQVVGQWIKRGRRATGWTPTIGSIDDFGRKFAAWWRLLQPEWRTANGDGTLKCDGYDWSHLRKCSTGANGLLSVMAALCYWGTESLTSGQRNAWAAAVDDVLFVVQQLS